MDNKVVVRVGAARSLSSRAGGMCSCEALEPRTLLSSVAYADLGAMVPQTGAASLGDGFAGPVVAVGDIDGDGGTDLLTGNAYRYLHFYSGAEVVFSGAAVISGKTGETIRTHEPTDSLRFGWSVAALGDIDADGVPDYAIGSAFANADPVAYAYSGLTGAILYTFGTHITGDPGPRVYGTTVAGPGDLNGDGHPDILVSFATSSQTVLYSGIDGSELRRFSDAPFALAGGHDYNGDGTPDFVLGSKLRQTAYSGASGEALWHVEQPSTALGLSFFLQDSADFNGDGHPDALISTVNRSLGLGYDGHARLYSGLDGALLLDLPGPADRGLAGAAGIVQDLNGDGIPEIAASVRASQTFEFGAGEGNGVYIYSGSNGELVAILTDEGPATLTPPEASYHRTPVRMAILGGVTAVDLNGDGFSEIITSAVRDSRGSIQETITLRLITFDGATLGSPVIDGAGSTGTGSIEAWGHLGATGFIIHESRTVFLTDLGFRPGDRVLHFSSWDEGVMMVVQPAGDPGHPVAWYAMSDLTSPRVFSIADAQRTGQPPGTYAFDRVVDADDGRVLVQMTRDGATPTAWVFGLITGSSPAVSGQLVYKFDGRPVALRDERIVGAANDDPAATLLWTTLAATPERIDGLMPVDLFLQKPDGQNPPPIVIVGLAQREGDPGERLYYRDADGSFRALPLIEGGSGWAAAAVSSAGDVAGTFTRAGGGRSVFLTRYSYADDPTLRTIDLLAQTLIGAPGGLNGATAQVAGLATSRTGFGPFEVYIRYDDPDVGKGRSAALIEVDGSGPYRAPSGAAFALSEDGRALVTRNIAGEILLYLRAADTGEWTKRDLAYSPGGIYGPPLYDVEHFGPITTWFEPGYVFPTIALATAGGLVLIEPYVTTMSGVPASMLFERYRVRNLTQELAGSQAITQSILTILPNTTRLRLVAGLNADGDLVMYGQTGIVTHDIGTVSAWAFANLYDQVLRPTSLPEPRFDVATHGDLVGYVTAWGGLNFAGIDADSGDLTVFWTAPGLSGWQVADLDQSLADPSIAGGVSHLAVYLTSWGGINLVGGPRLGVYWWTPGMGATWAFNELTGIAAGALLRPETVTAYVTPWDGLNVAGLDQDGKLWVYWWTPTVYWSAETIDAALPERDAAVERAGRLRSAVSGQGEISIFARSAIGNPLLYRWSPTADWALTDLLAAAPSYL